MNGVKSRWISGQKILKQKAEKIKAEREAGRRKTECGIGKRQRIKDERWKMKKTKTGNWNPETGKAVKCDLCHDRIEAGLKPACVTVCPTQCLYFGTPDEIPEVRRERYAKARAQEN